MTIERVEKIQGQWKTCWVYMLALPLCKLARHSKQALKVETLFKSKFKSYLAQGVDETDDESTGRGGGKGHVFVCISV